MWILIVLMLFSALPSYADDSLNVLMERMQNRYVTLGTLKANFTQTYASRRFSDQIVESGVVYFRRGGFMRWEYQQPEKKIFVSDGIYYYYYVPEDKQVIKVPVDRKSDQRSPTLFLAGRGDFIRDFKAQWADPRKGSNQIKLTPIKPQPDFQYLLLDIDPEKGLILRLQVADAYDNRTDYRFQNIEENPRLPEQFFAFRTPPGTDVIFQRPESE